VEQLLLIQLELRFQIQDVDLNKIDTKAEGIKQKYKAFGKDIEQGSYSDLINERIFR
jgi:hypothetical protein